MTTTLPRSPIADELDERVSVEPGPLRRVVAPVNVSFGAIGLLAFPIGPVGVAPDGRLEIPDETTVGWYRLGSAPGDPGATVLAAHVSWNGVLGPFARLADVQPGARLAVGLADGTSRDYVVTERAQYDKQQLPAERIWTRNGPESLVLITCGGEFNPEVRSYYDNIVVYAVPA